MTTVSSSTSSSEAVHAVETVRLAAFGRHLLWLVPVFFMLMVGFNMATVRLGLSALPQLANIGVQLDKLELARHIDTVFFGDSSLGRMIDMTTWQALSDEQGLSLSLTGGEGYVGDLFMLQQVSKRHRPSRVVLVHTPDMLMRDIAWSAYSVMRPEAPSIDSPLSRLIGERFEIYVSKDLLVGSLEGIVNALLDRSLPFVDDGYVTGKPPLVVRRSFDPAAPMVFEVADIEPEKILFLDLVIERCVREKLDCVYAFGPIWDEVCETSAPYLEAARDLIEARGMPVVDGTPLCVPLADLDNTEDHIVRTRRAHYTALLHARLVAFERAREPAVDRR